MFITLHILSETEKLMLKNKHYSLTKSSIYSNGNLKKNTTMLKIPKEEEKFKFSNVISQV